MFGSNGHYGHRRILSRYAGLAERKIPGLVQHGWNHDLGATIEDVLLPRPEPFYLWSERNLRECRKAGLSHVVPIGAPFLYLPRDAETVTPAPRSLLVMPSHGWEEVRIDHEFDLYAKDLEAIRGDFGSITVCLYWFEHQEERHRRRFESIGATVTTVGHRDDNPDFLRDLRRLLLQHEYVSANRVQTATFYALALGRKFFLHGPPVGVDARIDRTGKLFDAWQRHEYPDLTWDRFKDEPNRKLGEDELGLGFVKDPDALAELFSWKPSQEREHRARLRAHHERKLEKARRDRQEVWRERLGRLPLFDRLVRRLEKR